MERDTPNEPRKRERMKGRGQTEKHREQTDRQTERRARNTET